MRVHAAALVLAATGVLAPAASAQDQGTREVVIGPEYAAGGGARKILGAGYRDLWTTPVRLEVLDLQKEGGGLTPVRQVGQAQSVGLALKGSDGRAYTFRSLHKEPQRMLPEEWRDRVPGRITHDMTAGTHPAAGVMYPALAEAVGIPHTSPRLVVMPDDPALGSFRKTFGNLVGTIEEYPLAAGDGNPGFMGASQIIPSVQMWKEWMKGPENRPDARAYLRARVLELLVDNYDRHRGQWRWMKVSGEEAWQPLPEDPDFAFIRRDGLMMRSIRSQAPQFLIFSDEFPGRLDGALGNGAEMDRWMFAGLTALDFETVAREVQSRLTDAAVEQALRRMPAERYPMDAPSKLKALSARRGALVDYARRVYRYHAGNVDIHATDRAERVTVSRTEGNMVEVSIALADTPGEGYYRRRFDPLETSEVRIFLHGGDDTVVRGGNAGGPITVRVVAGGGQVVVDDSASGGTDVWRDAGTVDVKRGDGTGVRSGPWQNPVPVKDAPWIEPRSWGHWTTTTPIFGYAPDVSVYLGYGFTRTAYGFRTLPNRSEQTLQGALASGDMAGKVNYLGTFRRPGSGLGYQLHGYASGLESFNYFGAGNETPQVQNRAVYKTRQNVFYFSPALRYEAGPRTELLLAPELRYSSTPTDTGTIVATQAPVGVGTFGQAALRGRLAFDSRQSAVFKVRADVTQTALPSADDVRVSGLRLEASGFYVPKAWDVTSHYGGVDGMVAVYLGGPRAHLAVRTGGRKLWGDYAWFDAATIGGGNDRGFSAHRFSGDSSVYGSVSLRAWLASLGTPVVPLRIGVIAFTDVGRVWVAGEQSRKWHPSFGGGLLSQPVALPMVFNAVLGYSTEGYRFYFGLGYPF